MCSFSTTTASRVRRSPFFGTWFFFWCFFGNVTPVSLHCAPFRSLSLPLSPSPFSLRLSLSPTRFFPLQPSLTHSLPPPLTPSLLLCLFSLFSLNPALCFHEGGGGGSGMARSPQLHCVKPLGTSSRPRNVARMPAQKEAPRGFPYLSALRPRKLSGCCRPFVGFVRDFFLTNTLRPSGRTKKKKGGGGGGGREQRPLVVRVF